MIQAKDCKTLDDWMEWVTPERAVIITWSNLQEAGHNPTMEEVEEVVKHESGVFDKGKKLLAEMMMEMPDYAERIEKLEAMPRGTKLTIEQLAKVVDVPAETLEMNSIRGGLMKDDGNGNLTPTQKAIDEGMVIEVPVKEHIVSCYCNQIQKTAEGILEDPPDPDLLEASHVILKDCKEGSLRKHFSTRNREDGLVEILVNTKELARVDVINALVTKHYDWYDKQGHVVMIPLHIVEILDSDIAAELRKKNSGNA